MKGVMPSYSQLCDLSGSQRRIIMKYTKTKYPNIFSYETKKGKRYRIRRAYFYEGKKKELDESGMKTLQEAKIRLAEIERTLDMDELGYIARKKMTCDEYYQEYATRKVQTQTWSKDTKRKKDMDWKNHVSPAFGNTPLAKIDRPSYELWIANQLKIGARSSVKSYHDTLMGMLNDAVVMGVLERNRLLRVNIGESEIPAKDKSFSFEDYKVWMSAAERYLPSYDFAFVYIASFGLRRGEILGLKPIAIHAQKGFNTKLRLDDTRTNEEPEGKGSTKNKNERWITLNKRGTDLLNEALKEATEIKKDFNEILHQNDYLYMNPRTGKPYDVGQLNRLFKQINEITGLHAHPHLLRHYFTTQMAVTGVPKEHAASFLGHTNTHMTEKYTHIKDEVSDNVIDIVNSRLNYN